MALLDKTSFFPAAHNLQWSPFYKYRMHHPNNIFRGNLTFK